MKYEQWPFVPICVDLLRHKLISMLSSLCPPKIISLSFVECTVHASLRFRFLEYECDMLLLTNRIGLIYLAVAPISLCFCC